MRAVRFGQRADEGKVERLLVCCRHSIEVRCYSHIRNLEDIPNICKNVCFQRERRQAHFYPFVSV